MTINVNAFINILYVISTYNVCFIVYSSIMEITLKRWRGYRARVCEYENGKYRSVERTLRREIKEFCISQDIRSDIVVRILNHPFGYTFHFGVNWKPVRHLFPAAVAIPPAIYEYSTKTSNWLIKREIYYIRSNHPLLVTATFLVFGGVMFYFNMLIFLYALYYNHPTSRYFTHFTKASLLYSVFSLGLLIVLCMFLFEYQAYAADRFANKHSTVEELVGGYIYLEGLKKSIGIFNIVCTGYFLGEYSTTAINYRLSLILNEYYKKTGGTHLDFPVNSPVEYQHELMLMSNAIKDHIINSSRTRHPIFRTPSSCLCFFPVDFPFHLYMRSNTNAHRNAAGNEGDGGLADSNTNWNNMSPAAVPLRDLTADEIMGDDEETVELTSVQLHHHQEEAFANPLLPAEAPSESDESESRRFGGQRREAGPGEKLEYDLEHAARETMNIDDVYAYEDTLHGLVSYEDDDDDDDGY